MQRKKYLRRKPKKKQNNENIYTKFYNINLKSLILFIIQHLSIYNYLQQVFTKFYYLYNLLLILSIILIPNLSIYNYLYKQFNEFIIHLHLINLNLQIIHKIIFQMNYQIIKTNERTTYILQQKLYEDNHPKKKEEEKSQ